MWDELSEAKNKIKLAISLVFAMFFKLILEMYWLISSSVCFFLIDLVSTKPGWTTLTLILYLPTSLDITLEIVSKVSSSLILEAS